jgi:hypothetical protein
MMAKKGRPEKVSRPYGIEFKVKGEKGPITTQKWFQNRSDRDRNFADLKNQFGTRLISSKRIGK